MWLVLAGPAWSADAGEDAMRIRAVLIWGTNDPKPAGAKLKDLDDKVRKRLKAVFKWKDYYEVERKVFPIEPGKKIRLSDECEVTARHVSGATVEFSLYGKGKKVVTKTHVMEPGELLVLAGEAVNDTAWFVTLTRAGEKE